MAPPDARYLSRRIREYLLRTLYRVSVNYRRKDSLKICRASSVFNPRSVVRFTMQTLIRQHLSQEWRKPVKRSLKELQQSSPSEGKLILEAITTTNGAFITVNDEDIQEGLTTLAAKGIYVEPTSAVVVKAYQKFREAGIITSGNQVVSILTGIGLKASSR